jgi:hypothetical protein
LSSLQERSFCDIFRSCRFLRWIGNDWKLLVNENVGVYQLEQIKRPGGFGAMDPVSSQEDPH